MAVLLFLYLLAMVCWLGGMLFFTGVTTPVVFKVLPLAEAGKLVAGLFTYYYLLGYVAGPISVALAIYATGYSIGATIGGTLTAFAVERFGTERLQAVTRADIDARFELFREISHLDHAAV